jgi:hypothetical protein
MPTEASHDPVPRGNAVMELDVSAALLAALLRWLKADDDAKLSKTPVWPVRHSLRLCLSVVPV